MYIVLFAVETVAGASGIAAVLIVPGVQMPIVQVAAEPG